MAKKKQLKKKTPAVPAQKTQTAGASYSDTIADKLAPLSRFFTQYSIPIEIVVLLCIIAAGIAVRTQDLEQWNRYKQKAFFNNEPIHTTFDAWFYLSLAQDLVDDTYHKIDEKRGVPNSPPRPSPAPLISVMAATVAKATDYSLSWIGAVLPAVLGPLLAIPLYFLGRFYGGPLCGLASALVVLLYPFYIHRSNIGRFDTDCMNVTWSAAPAILFLMFGQSKTVKRYLFFAAGLLSMVLFMWWWDQAQSAVIAISLLPLLVALVFYYRPPKKEGIIFYAVLGVMTLVFLILDGFQVPVKVTNALLKEFAYISKEAAGAFPNIGVSISEQSIPSLDTIVTYTTQNMLAFLLAVVGLALLIWRNKKHSLYLISFFTLSVLAFTKANRFLIFLIPPLALGTGFFLSFIWEYRKQFVPVYIITPLLLILLCFPLYKSNTAYTQWPKESGALVEGMDYIKHNTPDNSVVWAWWDHGYAITYYSRRATINDGSIHGGERTVYTALPYTTTSYRLAANFMQFYTARGMRGMSILNRAVGNNRTKALELAKEVLLAGPELARIRLEKAGLKPVKPYKTVDDWLRFFYPDKTVPLYLFVDSLLCKTAGWWYWFGTWDIDRQDGTRPTYKAFYSISKKDPYLKSRGMQLNTTTGEFNLGGKRLQLSHMGTRTKKDMKEKNFYQRSRYRFEWYTRSRFGALMDSDIAESVFNKLFLRHAYPKKYFTPLRVRTPYYQIWEVRGDSLQGVQAHTNP